MDTFLNLMARNIPNITVVKIQEPDEHNQIPAGVSEHQRGKDA
jgi:hypothetical protein